MAQFERPNGEMVELIDRLQRGRSRYRLNLLLGAALRSLAVALAVFTVAELFRYLLPGQARALELDGQVSYWLAAAGLSVSLLIGLFLAWLRTPSLEQVAQLADARFALLQRMTTAYETHRRGPLTPVEKALIRDAAARTGEVDPASMVPLSFPRPLWPVVVALGAFLLVQVLPERAAVTAGADGRTTNTVIDSTSDERPVDAATAGQVRRIAELVGRDAEVRRDPYLEAVARSFDDLGRRLEAGEFSRSELEQEVGRLLQHLDRALGTDESSSLAELLASEGLGRSGASGEQEANAAREPGDEFQPRGAGDPETGEPNEGTSSADGGDNEMPPELEELLNRLEASLDTSDSGGQAPSRQAQGPDEDQSGGFYTDVDPELMARLEERQDRLAMQRAENRAGGQPVGAAQESNEGAGDLAGEGTQPLDGETQPGLDPAADQFEPVELPGGRLADGRRIRIEMQPETELSAMNDVPDADPTDWRRSREGRASGTLLGMMDRGVVSRYFIPPEENRKNAPE